MKVGLRAIARTPAAANALAAFNAVTRAHGDASWRKMRETRKLAIRMTDEYIIAAYIVACAIDPSIQRGRRVGIAIARFYHNALRRRQHVLAITII